MNYAIIITAGDMTCRLLPEIFDTRERAEAWMNVYCAHFPPAFKEIIGLVSPDVTVDYDRPSDDAGVVGLIL